MVVRQQVLALSHDTDGSCNLPLAAATTVPGGLRRGEGCDTGTRGACRKMFAGWDPAVLACPWPAALWLRTRARAVRSPHGDTGLELKWP